VPEDEAREAADGKIVARLTHLNTICAIAAAVPSARGPITLIQDPFGHRRLATTQTYAYLFPDQADQARPCGRIQRYPARPTVPSRPKQTAAGRLSCENIELWR
jgi:hypothetical protein